MVDALAALLRRNAFASSFVAFALGVIAAADGRLATALATAAACGIYAIAWRRIRGDARTVFSIVFAGFAVGAIAASLAIARSTSQPCDALGDHHIVALVVGLERPKPTENGESARVRIIRVMEPSTPPATSLRGAVALLDFPAPRKALHIAGRYLTVHARFDLPSGPRNDGEPSEKDALAEQGVTAVLASPSVSGIHIGGDAPGAEAWWARLRVSFAQVVEQRIPPLDATVLEGILWGDRGDLPTALRQEFSDTGTVHVLTTAGLHLGIFAALVAWLASALGAPRFARAAGVVAASWAYAALAGMHLPTIRAATMLTAGTIAQESGRGRTPSAVLAAAAYAVALPHPLVILTPSFAMSFSCVGGIALLGPALVRSGIREGCGLPDTIVELTRTSIAVQLAMWPLQALYFDVATPYAVFANLLVVPLVGVVMALGGALVVTGLAVPLVAAPLATVTTWSVSALVAIVEKFSALPSAHIDVPPPTHAFIVLYWAALAAFAWASGVADRMSALRRAAAPAAAALVLVYCAPGIAAAADPRLHLDAIDVGQADCFLIRAPGMHAMLVDGGGKLERTQGGTVIAQPIGDAIATRTVMPFLLRHWVLHLDDVVLTHPHGDHAGGLPVILEHERVGQVWDSAQLYSGPAYQRALDVIRERHIAWRKAVRGESFDLGSTTRVRILAPELPLLTGTASDINNNSVVMRVEFGRVAILMTGDAQSEAETRLLSHGGADLRADILKVGHHGSAYSSTPAFLAAVHPKFAVISCGLHNVFGHPSPRTLAALRAIGATIFRTDLDGGVALGTDGERIEAKAAVAAP